MTAYIVRIESPLLRILLWTLWFPVLALEFTALYALFGIGKVSCQLMSMYLVGVAGFKREKDHQ